MSNRSEIEQELIQVLSLVLGRAVPVTVTRASEPAWDSLKHMQIVFAVEERFGRQFTEAQIPELDSLSRFADLLATPHAP